MRVKEVYAIAMPTAKRREERYNIWVTAVVRPLSIVITAPFVNTKVKPTSITAISILVSIIGFGVLSLSETLWVSIMGWALFFAWAVLDGVDGNLARCQGSCSPLGDLWDTMGGYIAMVLMYFSSGIAAYFDTSLFDFCDKYVLLILGGATAIFSIFPRLMMHKKKSSNIESKYVKIISDKKTYNKSKIAAMNLVSPSGFMQVILLLCIVFHVLNFFVVFYFTINMLIMIYSLHGLLKEE